MTNDAFQRRAKQPHRLVMVTLAAWWVGACSADPSGPLLDATPATATVDGRFDQTFGIDPKRGKVRYHGRLAFTSNDGFIYTMDPDGYGITMLVPGYDPSWSPDAQRIAFSRIGSYQESPPYRSDLYVMNADGSNVTLVTRDGYQPTWSPDGQRLAFGCGGICVVDLDGTDRRVVTSHQFTPAIPSACIRDTDPTWSPNGTTIAFTRWPDVQIPVHMCLTYGLAYSFPFDFWTQVWFVEADGTGLRPLRGANGQPLTYAGWPSWSPDGSRLALYAAYAPGYESIVVANADGTGLRDVVRRTPANFAQFLGGPDWSPDGGTLVVGSGTAWGYVSVSNSATNPVLRPPRLVPGLSLWSWSRR